MRAVVLGLLIGAILFGPIVACVDAAERTSVAKLKMSRREKKALGLNLRNLLKVARELDKAGELDKTDKSIAAAQILTKVMETKAKAWKKARAEATKAERDWDWDAFLAFLEDLIPLLLMLLEIFSQFADATVSPALEVACAPPAAVPLTLAA